MSDNLPSNRYEDFYIRDENRLIVRGRDIKLQPQCKVCRLVPNLVGMGYEQDEAERAEKDLYRMIYTLFNGKEISDWLKSVYGYDIEHDSVYRHIKNHCPDPQLIMLDRLKKYAPVSAQRKFIDNLMNTMRLTLLKYHEDVAQGAVEIKPSDFTRMAEMYKDWQEDYQEDHINQLMEAMKRTVQKILPEDQQKDFEDVMRSELERLDEE